MSLWNRIKAWREALLYGFWGIVFFLVNFFLYSLLNYLGLDYRIANLIAIIIVKLLFYLTSKLFVFKTKTRNFKELAKEFVRYLVARGFTAAVEFIGLILLVQIVYFNEYIAKLFMQIITTVLNYILSKLMVFKKGENDGSAV